MSLLRMERLIAKRVEQRLVLLGALFLSVNVSAQSETQDDFELAYGGAEFVSIATGRSQSIVDVPAMATVISADEIKAMGAKRLTEILERVPGLHVSSTQDGVPRYFIRGIYSTFNPHVLLLINGTPMTNLFFGNRGQAWGGMPVQNIARIEVIRGPGSAVYGSDAFAGVINVITKQPGRLQGGSEVGVGLGSFSRRDIWALNTMQWGRASMATSLQYSRSDGHKERVLRDKQTLLDEQFGTSASLAGTANGETSNGYRWLDASMDVELDRWQARLSYQGRRDMGTAAGVFEALDPVGHKEADRWAAELIFSDDESIDDWGLNAKLSYLDVSNRSALVLLPPGTTGPFDAGVFSDGVMGNPDVYERHSRLDLSAFYYAVEQHVLRIGLGVNYANIYRVEESNNIGAGFSPLPSVVQVEQSLLFTPERSRTVKYFLLQDEWQLKSDWSLTTGIRYDDYSDFGSTTNPRLALVWQADYNLTFKALYGRAFRAPSSAEQFNIVNPVALGNPLLVPEIIDTYELGVDYRITSDWRTRLTLYRYKMKDIIEFVDDPIPETTKTAQNVGERNGRGFEWESEWRPSEKFELSAQYAYQHAVDEVTQSRVGYLPENQVYMKVNWKFYKQWSVVPQLHWIADRVRSAGDSRSPINDYTSVDVVVRRQPKDNEFEFSFTVKNVGDRDIREPSAGSGAIPNDLPSAGRNYYLLFSKAI